MAAQSLIQAQIRPDAGSANLEDATRRLQSGPRRNWRLALVGMMLLVSFALAGKSSVTLALHLIDSNGSWGGFFYLEEPSRLTRQLQSGMPPEDRLILFGDETQSSNSARWKPLWDLEPENPGFYLLHAEAHQRQFDSLPPDYLETGARLDPGNGWFQLMTSADQAEVAITRVKRTGPNKRHSGLASTYTIEDPELLEALIQQLHQAAHAERLDNYADEISERRFAALPPSDGILVNLWRSTVVGMHWPGTINIQQVARVVAAAAQHLADSSDLAAFQVLSADWEILLNRLLDRQSTLLDCMIVKASIGVTYPSLRDAAITLNAPEKEELIQRELRIREHAMALDEARETSEAS